MQRKDQLMSIPKSERRNQVTHKDVIHTDIYDPVRTKSIYDERCAVVFVDKITRYKIIDFAREKSQLPTWTHK